MHAHDLETPALYIDLDILERNLRRMQERCNAWGVGLRPHAKTHKIPELAQMQLAAGAIGLTVAKISEAEVMPGNDVLIAFPIMAEKAPRLRRLAESRRVTVVVDSLEAARAAGGVDALVEVDIGFARCGVQTVDDYERIADACSNFRGLFCYPASLPEPQMRRAADLVGECLQRRRGTIVSGGSTPSAMHTPLLPETTEVRFGTYALNDSGMIALGIAQPEDCALKVFATVTSKAAPDRLIIDGGTTTFADYQTRIVGGFGRIVDQPWTLTSLSDDRGVVAAPGNSIRVGDKLAIIPASVSKTINLHDAVAVGRAGRVEGTWKLTARGCLQ